MVLISDDNDHNYAGTLAYFPSTGLGNESGFLLEESWETCGHLLHDGNTRQLTDSPYSFYRGSSPNLADKYDLDYHRFTVTGGREWI